eukprot:ANDGO_02480.mRNA.1 Uncharacterized protein YLL056C
MSSVFIFGATGFIGSQVALAFRAAGYVTHGLVRSAEKAKDLIRAQVNVIEASLDDSTRWEPYAAKADVLVVALVDYSNQVAADRKVLDTIARLSSASPSRKTVIYTSGAWVYGNRASNERATEQESTGNAALVVKWRPAHEQEVLKSVAYDGIVLRPGCVYGWQGSLTASWISAALSGTSVSVPSHLDGEHSWAIVHVDDLAHAYVLAAEKGRKGCIYNVGGENLEVRAAVSALFAATNKPLNANFPVPSNPFEEALAGNLAMSSEKARNELGWVPFHTSFAADAHLLIASFRAYQ